MALVVGERVKETTTTTGTGTYSLAGAATGFQTFVAGIGNGNTCPYFVTDGTDWEVGIGTVADATPDTLARTTVLASTNGGAAVNWGAGTKTVACSLPAARTLLADLSGVGDGDFLRRESGIFVPRTTAEVLGDLGAAYWTQVVNESGTSFTNWTGISGTWSSDGTVIKQTDTGASWRSAYYTTKLAQGAGVVHQAEIKMVSGGGATRAVGLAVLGDASATGSTAVDLRVESATDKVNFERLANATVVSITTDWGAEDAWITLKIVCQGACYSAYIGGTLIGTARGDISLSGGGNHVLLTSYACTAHFRNIQTWVMTGNMP